MNNYPGSSRPHLPSPHFPPLNRQQILQSEVTFKPFRQQPYDGNDRFHRNTDFPNERRLMSPTNPNFQSPRGSYDSLNSDLPFRNRETNSRLDYRNEEEYFRSQRFSPIDRRNPSNFRGSPLDAEAYRSQDMDLNYPRRTFLDERNPSMGNYSDRDRLRLSQRLDVENELLMQREQSFNRFPSVNNNERNAFPPMRSRSPLTDYPDSNSFRGQPLNDNRLYDDIPDSGIRPGISRENQPLNDNRLYDDRPGSGIRPGISRENQPLNDNRLYDDRPGSGNITGISREEEILKEIRALQQQQKIKELLDASLLLAEKMKASAVLGNFNKESLSNNTSSSAPDTFINKAASDPGTTDNIQNCNIFPENKPFIPPNSNSNAAEEFSLDKTCNSSILNSISKPNHHPQSEEDGALPTSSPITSTLDNSILVTKSTESNDFLESEKDSTLTAASSPSISILESSIYVSNSTGLSDRHESEKEDTSSASEPRTSFLENCISVSNSSESKNSPEREKGSASSSCLITPITESRTILPHSPKKCVSTPFDSTGNTELNKVLNLSPTSNSSASDWAKSLSIPFLGDTTDCPNDASQISLKSTESQEMKTDLNIASIFSQSESGESKKLAKSVLEDALATLEISEPVVGLDYIVENKGNVSDDGSFSFYCQLCNSSIARPMIIAHVLSYKHRMRYVKTKDEDMYDDIMRYKVNQFEKEEEIYKASEMLEEKYGRGHVVIQDDISTSDVKKKPPITISFKKVLDSPKPTACEHNNDFDLEQRKLTNEVKKDNTITPEDMNIASPTKAPVKIPISSHKKSNLEIPKQVSAIESENTNVYVKNESLTPSSPLKTMVEEKVRDQSSLNSQSNWNDAIFSNLLSSIKRPSSPRSVLHKRIKTTDASDINEIKSLSNDLLLHKDLNLQDPTCVSQSSSNGEEEKRSLTETLQHMTKLEISSNEEAEMISKTVNVLLNLLLRYKLNQEPKDAEKKLMQSFLNSHMDKPHANSDIQGNIVANKESISSQAIEDTTPKTEIKALDNKEPSPTISIEQNSTTVIPTTASTPDAFSASQPSSNPSLQPPPFFCFPNSSAKSSTSTTPSTTVTAGTNWNSHYNAHTYPYQQQGYVGVPPMYQPYTLPMAHLGPPMVPPLHNVPPLVSTMTGPSPALPQSGPPLMPAGLPPLPNSTGGPPLVVPLPGVVLAVPPLLPSKSGPLLPPSAPSSMAPRAASGPAAPPLPRSTSAPLPPPPPPLPLVEGPTKPTVSGSTKPPRLPYPGGQPLLPTPPQPRVGGPPNPPTSAPPLPPSDPLLLPPPPPPPAGRPPPKPPLPPSSGCPPLPH